MSTRSGKRIHNSSINISVNEAPKSERRTTRSKHLKENCDGDNNNKVIKVKRRKNYVSFPTENDETQECTNSESVISAGHKTLRESNLNCSPIINDLEPPGKCIRLTRRTKKFAENNESTLDIGITNEKNKVKKQSKKNKKKENCKEPDLNTEIALIAKKSKRSKERKEINVALNKSNISTDSFHSAADSPVKEVVLKAIEKPNGSIKSNSRRASKRNSESFNDNIESHNKKCKLSVAINDTEKIDTDTEITKVNEGLMLDTTYEKESIDNSKSEIKNSTFDKSDTSLGDIDSTHDKNNSLNILIERSDTRKSLKHTMTPTSPLKIQNLSDLNKQKECRKLNLSTSETEKKLNPTLEKLNGQCEDFSDKSLVSSDDAANLTFDKSNDNSRITITSDDSSSENIVNTTPLLIESSIDETSKSNTSLNENLSIKTSGQHCRNSEINTTTPATPLKREGTFTKEGPDVILMEETKVSSQTTPTKNISLPSAGCTPYNICKSSQKEKSILNVTHSIEKPGRRSSSVEHNPRMTKVMFCSPINTPAVVASQARKVIKSNLKGSNKSFIFDDSVPQVGRLGRKRSLTQDAEGAGAKRSRLSAAQRLSRPRTTSAAAKLSESLTPLKKQQTPLKKQLTPSKDRLEPRVGRTRLPNFAALHQRQFDKMESLDECQERRAKRARQLLTPTGPTTVLERISPRNEDSTNAEPSKSAPKKTETPTKTPKLPTLDSLRPGYTRFGFKMGSGVNPFSTTAKTDVKPKIKVVNTALARQPSYPSLAGATSRKDVAKQTVMREKSFTSLSDKRNVKRIQNRTVIKGVRTNRRFELQMRLRDLNA